MKDRTVERILHAEIKDMAGIYVRQPFPTQQIENINPFLLLHHHLVQYPEGIVPHRTGVDPHPHRGFSPVTFVYRGGVHHRDSRGNNSIVYAGGTQWMHAGMGVIHSERPPHDIEAYGNVQEIVQVWVNSPASHKMDQPSYTPLHANETPVYQSEGTEAGIVAGEFKGIRGPVRTITPVIALRLTLKAGAAVQIPVPETYNAFLYLLDGQVKINGFGLVDGYNLALLSKDGKSCSITAAQDTRLLFLAGEPIDEPIAQHGPFVMNTQTELMMAMRDYQQGKMGMLIEDR